MQAAGGSGRGPALPEALEGSVRLFWEAWNLGDRPAVGQNK